MRPTSPLEPHPISRPLCQSDSLGPKHATAWRTTLISRASAGLFALAKLRDELARRVAMRRRLSAYASVWAERAGITRDQTAVGINPDAPIPAVLLGLRIGACQLEIPCTFAGVDAIAIISHDVARGRDLRVVIRPRVPLQNPGWPGSPELLTQVRHIESSTGRPCLLDGVSIGQLWHDDDLDPLMMGSADLIEVGNRKVASTQWTAHLLGAFTPADQWHGSLAGANLSLAVYPSGPRRTGVAALAQSPRLGRLQPLAEWATWRRDAVAPNLARLMRAELKFPEPVTSLQAETYLLDHVCRLLHLYSGARPTLCGLWDPQQKTGRLLDLGRSLVGERRKVADNSVVLAAFLSEVAPTWDALSDADKKLVKVGMDALAAMPPDLEPAVVAGAMTLEFLAAAFLPKATNSYPLTKSQRKDILAGLTDLAAQLAAGSTWERDLPRSASRLWPTPAEDRISELTSTFGIRTTPAELKAYIKVRNSITHGRPDEASLEDKVTTMSFQLHAGGVILLRTVGFTGAARDVRGHQLRPPRPDSRVK